MYDCIVFRELENENALGCIHGKLMVDGTEILQVFRLVDDIAPYNSQGVIAA